MTNEKQ